MQAIVVKENLQNLDALKPTEIKIPHPLQSQILVKVDSVAANFFDILQVQGKYQIKPQFPWVAGFEFAGTVQSTGQRVFGGQQGAFAEYIAVEKDHVLPIPPKITYEQASTLFITAPTAYLAIFIRAKLKRNEIILIHAGAGGVGLVAVQMAKAIGAIVIATASTLEKLEICKEFGANFVINYKAIDWIDQIKKIAPNGVDVVYDPVGMVESSLKVCAWNARVLVIGFAGGKIEKIAMNKALLKQISIQGVFWGGMVKNQPELVQKVWTGILALIEDGKLKPTVFKKVYQGLRSVPDALIALGNRGKKGF